MFHRSLNILLRRSIPRLYSPFCDVAKRKLELSMVKTLTVDGYDALTQALKEQTGKIYVLFSGTPDKSGVSWCPDCVKADPVINRNLDKAPDDAVLIHCHVGDRTYWKDQNNAFRKDPKINLKCVPTLLKIGSPQKLEEEQCLKDDLIQMMFEEEDD